MNRILRPLAPALLFGFAIGLIGACNSLIGAGVPNEVPSFAGTGGGAGASAQCTLASECPDQQICLFQTCSEACAADKDCQFGRCLQTKAGNACVMQASTSCSADDECPAGSECKSGLCRSACTSDAQCLDDQSCNSGACVGKDPTHDSGSTAGSGGSAGSGASGGDAGAAGAAGASTGGASAGGMSAGGSSGAAAAGMGGMGGAISDAGTGKIGEPCKTEGDLTCVTHASPLRLVCQGGVWVSGTTCDAGQVCDSASMPFGQCGKVAADCQGHNPGDSFCNAATRVQCGADLITEKQTVCASVALCAGGTGAACAVCTAEQHQCVGKELQRCKDDGSGFMDEMACTDDTQPCNALAGACTALACLKAGDLKCDGDTLEKCNDAMTAYTTVKNCGANLCNANVCDVCIPNATGCFNATTASACTADGQTLNKTACMSGTPHCIGNGKCVQCVAVSDCPAPSECYTQSCNGSGTCAPSPVATNTPCGAGNTKFCSATHACVECNTDGQCSGTKSLCRANACVNPSELVGFSSGGTSTTLVTGNLYLVKLPLMPHNCVLEDLGIVATANASPSASVKLGLYGADGSGMPTGAVLDYTKTPMTVATGALTQLPGIPGVTLSAGKQYYIAVSTNTASTISIATTTLTGAGYKAADTYSSTASSWPTAPVGPTAYANQLAVFIDVTDTD